MVDKKGIPGLQKLKEHLLQCYPLPKIEQVNVLIVGNVVNYQIYALF